MTWRPTGSPTVRKQRDRWTVRTDVASNTKVQNEWAAGHIWILREVEKSRDLVFSHFVPELLDGWLDLRAPEFRHLLLAVGKYGK